MFARPAEVDLDAAEKLLSPNLFSLFLQLSPSEQAHALKVLANVQVRGFAEIALLEAALLHDIGKVRYPLRLWERVWIVLGKAFLPSSVESWGQSAPIGWRRPFVVAAHHAEWGAQITAEAGAGELTVKLVRAHQTASPPGFSEEEAVLLSVLQQADSET